MKKIVMGILIIVFLITGQAFASNNIQEQEEKLTLSDVSDLSVVIISFINLIFVIAFYFNDQRNKSKDKKTEYKFFWYKDYVVKDAVLIIEEHISNCCSIIEDCKKNKKKKTSVEQYGVLLKENIMKRFTESNNQTKKRISELLNIIDGNISTDIIKEFIEIQDIFTNTVQNVEGDLDDLYNKISQKKIVLLNKLYKYGLENIL